MSRNDILRLILPTPDFSPLPSSLTIRCVFGRGLGRLGTTAPALRLRSDRKDSLSEANFLSAFSKSTSLSPRAVPLIWEALMVALLRLLFVLFFETVAKDWPERRAS